jgi:3'-5' exoribonuclease
MKIERLPLHQMRPGQTADFFAVLYERTRRTTRDGKPYYSLRFRDRHRQVTAPIWSDSPLFELCELDWQLGQHFKIRAAYQEHPQYGPQIEIQNIRAAAPEDWVDGYDPAAFESASRFDADALYQELVAAAGSITNPPLQELVIRLLRDHREPLCRFPAARKNHHAYRVGLLEHTVSVLRTGIYLADKYREYYPDLRPALNKDLIIAGCILHDIGKLSELDYGPLVTTHTVPGELIGHILIGRDMVREAAKGIVDLDPELLLLLEHIIISHQGLPEWGSPKEPMIPEALLVHHADDIDAKMNILFQALTAPDGDEPFTDASNAMRRRFLKKRTQ